MKSVNASALVAMLVSTMLVGCGGGGGGGSDESPAPLAPVTPPVEVKMSLNSNG